MRLILLTTVIAIMGAMQVPALAALNIDDGKPDALPEAPTVSVTAPAQPSGWTEQVQANPAPVQAEPPVAAPTAAAEPASAPVIAAPVVVAAAPAPLPAQTTMLEVSTQRVQDSLCFKTQEQMKILNTTLPSTSPFATGAAVPEPGSIAALSAGFGGLLLQLRRTRKR